MPEKIESPIISEPISLQPINSIQKSLLENEVIESLRQIFDPEIPVNVYDLGLIYGIEISNTRDVLVTMTLTSPACPVAESLPGEIETAVRDTEGVASAKVTLVWDPPYSLDLMPDHIKLELGFM